MKRCKIKNDETEFQMTESENFWNHSELLSTENENCDIGSVKRVQLFKTRLLKTAKMHLK